MKCTVYVNEYANTEGKVWNDYKIGLSRKKDDKWYNLYMKAKFKDGIQIANKTKITATNIELGVDIWKDGTTHPLIFINEFSEIVQDVPTDGFQTVSAEDELPF